MPAPQLRVFSPDDNEPSESVAGISRPLVPVSLGDLLPVLMHAAISNRVWLQDFADETLQVSQELYEILLAYRRIAEEEPLAEQQQRRAA